MPIKFSKRIENLNNRLKTVDYNRALPWYFEDLNVLDLPENEWLRHEPIVIRKAYSIKYVAENLPISIYDDELIVGVPNQSSVEFGMSLPMYLTDEERKLFEPMGLSEYSLVGHHAPNWSLILEKGISQLREEIENSKEKLDENSKDYVDKLNELKAMDISLQALEIFSNRYADALSEMAQAGKSTQRQVELNQMAENLRNVPLNPAHTLWEALQSFWITYVLLASNGEFLPLGRLDQHFIKYYENDNEETIDLLSNFLIKCNERNVLDAKLLQSSEGHWRFGPNKLVRVYHEDEPEDSENNKFFGQEANNRMMTTVVGGLLSDGTDGTNELSKLFLEIQDELGLLMPTFGVRLGKKTPEDFLKVVAKILLHGQGEPVIYNDDAIIENHEKLSIESPDVTDYSSDGCWEVIFPGNDNFAYGNIYTLQCLEWTMNQGVSVKTGRHDGLTTTPLNEIESYEKLYSEFLKQVENQLWKNAKAFVKSNGISEFTAPDPLLSTICNGCIERGLDFTGKGAKYQHRMLLLVGFADTVDSLTVIKKLVFEEKKLSLEELNEALLNNWKGHEELRHYIQKNVPTYGNNDEFVNSIVVGLIDDYQKILTEIQEYYRNIVFTGGIGTFHMYALWGNQTGASANGRYAYDPVAPNYSPVPGTNIDGPLAAIISSTKADLSNFMTGTPIDIQINAKDFEGEDGLARLIDMIRGFMELKGQLLTISAYSVEQLKDAKIHPEKYRDLRVRMGGLSAYFVQLAPVAQDKIIERFTC